MAAIQRPGARESEAKTSQPGGLAALARGRVRFAMSVRHWLMLALGSACLPGIVWADPLPVTGLPEQPYSYSRKSSFEYYAAEDGRKHGLLKTERVEPGAGMANLCLQTLHEWDAYGNKTKVTTSNCAGASGDAVIEPRVSEQAWSQTSMPRVTINGVEFALTAGHFPLQTKKQATATLTHVTTSTFDPRFGGALTMVTPDELQVRVEYDDFGRKVREYKPDGTSVRYRYCILDRAHDSSNSDGCGAGADAPPEVTFSFVVSWPVDAEGGTIGPMKTEFKDRLGRTVRVAVSSFNGASQPEAIRFENVIRDTVYDKWGTKVYETEPYWSKIGASITLGDDSVGVTKYVVDAMGRPVEVFTADPEGSQNGVSMGGNANNGLVPDNPSRYGYGQYGNRQARRDSFTYVGQTTYTRDDTDGASSPGVLYGRKIEKNPIGQVFRVTDRLGGQVVHQYDAFGNLRYIRDPLGNTVTQEFDIRGRKVRTLDKDAGTTIYAYNALGELVKQQTAVQAGAPGTTVVATQMRYDRLGRMTQRVVDEFTSNWYYDRDNAGDSCGNGRLCETSTSHGVRRRYGYDTVGRPANERLDVLNGSTPELSLVQSREYDARTGRLSLHRFPTGLALRYGYTGTYGFLDNIQLVPRATINPLPTVAGGTPGDSANWSGGKVLWRAESVSAWGTLELSSNGRSTDENLVTRRVSLDGATGRILRLSAGQGTGTLLLNQYYTWNSVDQMTERKDGNGAGDGKDVVETFEYDRLNRLKLYRVDRQDVTGDERTVRLDYNGAGMLLRRSDLGTFRYPEVVTGQTTTRPHALQSFTPFNGTAIDYLYTANGNLRSASGGKYRTVEYTSFNQPSSQAGAAGPDGRIRYTWQYDEGLARLKEVQRIASGADASTRTTWRLHPDNAGGLGFEHEVSVPDVWSPANPNTRQSRHYVTAMGQVVAVLVTEGNLPVLADDTVRTPPEPSQITLRKVEFWQTDHLGSLITTADHMAKVTARYAYDPFGQRRFTDGQADGAQTLAIDWDPAVRQGTGHGFTGHEHLDDIGLVHMNGRLYDARLGVFMQPDPFIQEVDNLQNLHRYGYCYANPMGCRDPSGMIFKWLGRKIKAEWKRSSLFRLAATIAVGYWLGPGGNLLNLSPAAASAVGGFASGAVSSGNLEGALQGTFSAMLFHGASIAAGSFTGAAKDVASVALHGVVGCVTSVAGGNKCGPGALSAAFSKTATVRGWIPDDVVGGTIASAVVGGTASVLGGGKFANGAQTAAFGYLFNCLSNPGRCTRKDWDEIRAAASTCRGAECRQIIEYAREARMPMPPDIGQVFVDVGLLIYDWGLSILVPPVATLDRLVVTPLKFGYQIYNDNYGDAGATLAGAVSQEVGSAVFSSNLPSRAIGIASGYYGRTVETAVGQGQAVKPKGTDGKP